MSTWKRLSAVLAAGALGFLLVGTALAVTGASDQGVTPTLHDAANITLEGGGGNDAADCDAADGIETGDSGGSDTTDNGVTVVWTYDGSTKEFGFTATGGLVTIAYVKGGNAYNEYNYVDALGAGVSWDGGMFAPDVPGGGPAGLSHAVFCTGPGEEPSEEPSFEQSEEPKTDEPSEAPSEEPTREPSDEPSEEPSFEQSFEDVTDAPSLPDTATIGGTNRTGSPADGAWLLVVALGVLLASIVVLTPARARNR
jgi:hypothetical protein